MVTDNLGERKQRIQNDTLKYLAVNLHRSPAIRNENYEYIYTCKIKTRGIRKNTILMSVFLIILPQAKQ